MKEYPSIDKLVRPEYNVYVQDKKDGTLIRTEWSKKRGFYKFGTKTQMLGEDHPVFGEAVGLVQKKYGDDLGHIFTKEKFDNTVCFLEFFGPNSFAGSHDLEEAHDVLLFDVSPLRQGILPPEKFMDLVGHLDVPKVLHFGKVNQEFVEQVRASTLEGMTFEGVVCKGAGSRKSGPIMFKIKSRAWLDRLHTFCKDDEALFERLA